MANPTSRPFLTSYVGKGVAPRLSIISAGVQTLNGGTQTIATAGNKNVTRRVHTNLTGKAVKNLRFLYSNHRASGTPALEVANANPIIVSGSQELLGSKSNQSGPRPAILFGGQPTVTINNISTKQSGFVISDPYPGPLAPGATMYERVGPTVGTNGQVIPVGSSVLGGTTGAGIDNGEGWIGNVSTDYLYDGGSDVTITATNAIYSSVCLLGELVDGTVATSLAICGDSIGSNGQDDAGYAPAYGGWPTRGLAAYPTVNVGFAGEQLAGFANNPYTRDRIIQYATHVFCTLGRNELTGGSAVANFKANMLILALRVMSRGQNLIACTILPAPTSTDGWYTLANMTADANDANRLAFNSWLTDTSASGFVAQATAQVASIVGAGKAKVYDACAPVEVNAAGMLTTGGGLVFPATQTFDTGTATAVSGKVLTDSTKNWTVNAFRGRQIYIVSGTGAGQGRCIASNTATTVTIAQAWTTSPDTTSVYRIDDAMGFFGVHPGTRMHTLIGNDLASKVAALVA